MSKYAVGMIDWYKNDMTHVIVEADGELEALFKAGVDHGFFVPSDGDTIDDYKDVESFKQECFNRDGMMDAILIDD